MRTTEHTCTVTLTEIALALGVEIAPDLPRELGLSSAVAGHKYPIVRDWADRDALSVADAGAFFKEFREARAKVQAKQDELNASRAEQWNAKQKREYVEARARMRESQRKYAITEAVKGAVGSLRGNLTPEREAQAAADAAEAAAERWDLEHPE